MGLDPRGLRNHHHDLSQRGVLQFAALGFLVRNSIAEEKRKCSVTSPDKRRSSEPITRADRISPLQLPIPLMGRYKWKPHNLFYFRIAAKAASCSHCFFSIREITSVAIIAGDMQAVTEVYETAQGLMDPFEDAMAVMGCAGTESGAYGNASAAFEEASSQLEELGFDYEITSEGFSFSRSGTAVGEYDPATRTGAAPFLGLVSGDSRSRLPGPSDRRF
jgi:hypothetical protein